MKNQLRYVGITHETADVGTRQTYSLSNTEQAKIKQVLSEKFELSGLLLLSTCNRLELYFESAQTTAADMRNFFIIYINQLNPDAQTSPEHFLLLDQTVETAHRLLHVVNGLRSAIIGDKQIIAQVKDAYKEATGFQQQGSMLERAIQSAFRSHKRISKESGFRAGSVSTAYTALKTIENHFSKSALPQKKLLIIGAGTMAIDVLEYVSKFSFHDVFIANRTRETAEKLAATYGVKVYPWQQVLENNFVAFDGIISAVSSQKHLISNLDGERQKKILIDLAIPSNIDPSIRSDIHTVYNIDEVTAQTEAISQKQLAELTHVEQIIQEELDTFVQWIKKEKARSFLRAYKQTTMEAIRTSIPKSVAEQLSPEAMDEMIESISNKLMRKPAVALNQAKAGEFSSHQYDFFDQAFNR